MASKKKNGDGEEKKFEPNILCPLCQEGGNRNYLHIYSMTYKENRYVCYNCFSCWVQSGIASNDNQTYLMWFENQKAYKNKKIGDSLYALNELKLSLMGLFNKLSELINSKSDFINPVTNLLVCISIFVQTVLSTIDIYVEKTKTYEPPEHHSK